MLNLDTKGISPDAWKKLKKAITTGRVAHAYLFQGPGGSGREQAAVLLAACLNCDTPSDQGQPCGQCAACQKIAHGNHPNIHTIAPDGATIKLYQFKELKKELSLRRVESGFQVIVIKQAEKMTVQAANSMLKTIEEPPEQTIFILIAENLAAILPTIISRCQKVSFTGLAITQHARILADKAAIKPELARIVLLASGGGAEAAETLLDNGFVEVRQRVLDKMPQLQSMKRAQLIFLAEEWSKEFTEEILQVIMFWQRDLVVWAETESENLLLNQDKIADVKENAADAKALQAAEIVLSAQQAVGHNANKRLTLETMLLQWSDLYR